jgi:uncharacterized membrane protein YcaP (DUF421 family)
MKVACFGYPVSDQFHGGHSMLLTSCLRTVFFYFFLLITLRTMGKRGLGSLGPLDLVVAIIMAEAAAIPIEDPQRPLMLGVVPIVTLVALEIGLSRLCLASRTVRHLISGKPSIIVRDGRLVHYEMRRLRYGITELMEQLRVRGYHNLMDVEMAILECDGELSVLPKSQRRTLTPADLGLRTEYEGPTHTLVIDGEIDYGALRAINLDEAWLRTRLAEEGFIEARDVLLALIDSSGRLLVQTREDNR